MNLFNKPILAPKEFKDKFKYSDDYLCPKCSREPLSSSYEFLKEPWPKIFNRTEFHSDQGSFYNWEEYHKCIECGTAFWFKDSN